LEARDVLIDTFGRIREEVGDVVRGLGPEQLSFKADQEANSIAWLVWHLTRVQDDHVSEVAGHEQAWVAEGWAERFALALEPLDTGYGHGRDEVARVKASAELLEGYHEAVYSQTEQYLKTLSNDDLDRVVDRRWDPPVTLGVRLVSVAGDDLQHVGQAAFAKGLVLRRAGGA
jgi:Protein of unknown function (DUF664)